ELTPAALKTVAQGLIAENCRVFREAQRFPNQAAEAYLPIGDKLRDHRGWAHSLETSLNLAKHHDNCARNSPSSPPADGGHPGPCLHHLVFAALPVRSNRGGQGRPPRYADRPHTDLRPSQRRHDGL